VVDAVKQKQEAIGLLNLIISVPKYAFKFFPTKINANNLILPIKPITHYFPITKRTQQIVLDKQARQI
jgi:hypothetical protein